MKLPPLSWLVDFLPFSLSVFITPALSCLSRPCFFSPFRWCICLPAGSTPENGAILFSHGFSPPWPFWLNFPPFIWGGLSYSWPGTSFAEKFSTSHDCIYLLVMVLDPSLLSGTAISLDLQFESLWWFQCLAEICSRTGKFSMNISEILETDFLDPTCGKNVRLRRFSICDIGYVESPR